MTWAAAGPLCTLYLALLGAEVIKVESQKSLDIARRGYYTPVQDINASPNFNDMNLNKLDLRVNMGTAKGQRLVRDLATVSDVLINNFRPGVMERWGLGYEDVRRLRPDIVMLSSSTAGQKGPERDLAGYATTFGAFGGLGHITGYPDGPATEIWDSVDMRLGTSIALASLMGLYHRQRTGQGQHIDLSSREVISTNIGDIFLDYFMNGRIAGPQGNRDEIMAPLNCDPCRGDDQWISIAVETDAEWRALCRVAGQRAWAKDPRFADRYSRWMHQDALDGLLAGWTRQHATTALAERLQRAGVPAVPSMSVAQILRDPHTKARGAFMNVRHPKLGMTHPARPPWILSETPASSRRYGPMFGEHIEQVFGEVLGLLKAEIKAMAAEGVFE
jgi:benzylsuccinate CoA-transferase BbsF subunit